MATCAYRTFPRWAGEKRQVLPFGRGPKWSLSRQAGRIAIAIPLAKGFQGFPREPRNYISSIGREKRPSQALLAEIPKAFLEPLEATRSIRPILLPQITGGSSSWMWDGGIGQIGQAADPGSGCFD